MSSASGPPLFFLLLLFIMHLFLCHPILAHEEKAMAADGSSEMTPVASPGFESVVLSGTRRRLRNFQICAVCTCCGGPRGLCLPSPCCYAINCNIPNRPFGFCAFTPKTCNCLGCHL